MNIIITNGKDIRANITPPYTQDEIEYATDCDDHFISKHGRAIIKQLLSERDALEAKVRELEHEARIESLAIQQESNHP